MSDGNQGKSTEELLAEIAALKEELVQRGPDSAKVEPEESSAPVFSAPSTRRRSLVSWVAPVILALPVVQAMGMVLKSGTAYAAATKSPTPAPTRAGRCIVPPGSTAAPTFVSTTAPTPASVPTDDDYVA